jgi:hypothetical protein
MKTVRPLSLLRISAGAAGAVLMLAGAVWAATPVAAPTQNQGIQISPPTATFAGDKGTTLHGTVKVTNLTNQTLNVAVGKQNFVAKGEEGETELTDNADPLYSLAPWFTVDTTALAIPALGTKEVHYSISVPADAEPGGRYGSITFTTAAPKLPNGQSGAVVQQAIGNLVFMRINGPAKEQLSVETFESGHYNAKTKAFNPATWFSTGPVDLLTRVKNTGNVHEKPTGTITVKNLFGFTVSKVPLDAHFVIPGATRRLHNTWPTGKQHGWLLGHYTATLNATYDSGKTLTASTSFTVVPWAAVIALIVILILLFIIWRRRRRFGRAFRILAGRE